MDLWGWFFYNGKVDEIKEIVIRDKSYPSLLKEINEPPERLFARGNIDVLHDEKMLAVVGSRKASHYGKQAINKILSPVAQSQVSLVSGLAYGIDSMAHKICVDNNVPTVAVLGTGIDDATIYPVRHYELARDIISTGGVIVSEYPPGTPPLKKNFPERNRIIAGLTKATLVVQAAMRSGSLITARLALEEGRDVAAIPGYITDPLSEGVNQLIQQGASPILSSQDILDLLGISAEAGEERKLQAKLTEQQRVVLSHLSNTPTHVDQISISTSVPMPVLSVILTELEMLDVAEHVGGMKYVKNDFV